MADSGLTSPLQQYPVPLPKMGDFPVVTSVCAEVIAVTILLFVSRRFDVSGGPLTIALMVMIAFVGIVVYSVIFNIPQDEETATIIGGLVAAFGAVVAFWLKRDGNPPPG